ncbi:MAG: hypothetical protein Q4B34_02655, partial [Candidatus Saccharibacteria bacterium]|nr:hypothetical protein [Candidatus Saccharibacteria bacterium]
VSVEEMKEAYSRYRETKKKVFAYEMKNTKFLILYPASDANIKKRKGEDEAKKVFYNMGGHSAIIYVYALAPKIGRKKATLRRDFDNTAEKFASGICSIMDLDKLTELLAKINVRRMPDRGDIVMFALPREYAKSEIKEFLKSEQKRLDNLNKLIYSKVLFPDIHRQILDLKKLIPPRVKNMNREYREVIGDGIIKALLELMRAYSEMVHGDLEMLAAGKRMSCEIDMILAHISMYNELRLWDVATCSRIAEVAVGAQQLIRGKIINKAAKEANANNG